MVPLKGKETIRDFLAAVGWATMMAAIVLQGLYEGIERPLPLANVLLLIAASVLAGAVLADPERIVLAYVGMLAMSMLAIFVSLVSPALLGEIKYPALRAVLYEGSIGIVTRVTLLYLMIPGLMGGFTGGIIGERLELRKNAS